MTYIIAEAGVNHNGNEEIAYRLIDEAHLCGADAIKFQTFRAKDIATNSAAKADYQKSTSVKGSQLEMLSRLELSFDAFCRLNDYCKKLGIEFLSTAFDFSSLDLLVNTLGLKRLKISSGDITNAPLVLAHAQSGSDLIVSTGMATLADIEAILGVIAFGYLESNNRNPSKKAFEEAYMSKQGQELLRNKVTLLHCTSEYPAPVDQVNLNALDTLKSCFKLSVGYSDHTEGLVIPIAAAAKGALILEKHFTLDRSMEGPDHKSSIDPCQLKELVKSVNDIQDALGSGIKGCQNSELKNRELVRKSLVAEKSINRGDLFTSENLAIKRPGSGLEPIKYWDFLDKAADNSYKPGDLIDE